MATFNHITAARYALQWARGTNPDYGRFDNDCTNFVSQALFAGGWTMVGGSFFDSTSDSVWWFGKSPLSRSSYTWGGAQNLANFLSKSGRATQVDSPTSLGIGDVVQIAAAGLIHHSMVVTNKSSSDLLLSYHTSDHLDESLAAIKSRLASNESFVYWFIRPSYA